jgi:hypothetical protein
MENCSKAEQRSLLTLVPNSWGQVEAAEFFSVPIILIRSSRKQLAEARRILSPIKTKQGRKLKKTTKELVENFYKREDVSRCCPGANDTVSVKDPTTGKREREWGHLVNALHPQIAALVPEAIDIDDLLMKVANAHDLLHRQSRMAFGRNANIPPLNGSRDDSTNPSEKQGHRGESSRRWRTDSSSY